MNRNRVADELGVQLLPTYFASIDDMYQNRARGGATLTDIRRAFDMTLKPKKEATK